MKNKKTLIVVAVVLIVVVLFFLYRDSIEFVEKGSQTDPYNEFAQCITDSKAKFYCADWAPACNEQKKMFSSGATLLPYIECSVLDSKQQNLRCKKDDIGAYPTWEFANGKRIENLLSFNELEKETGCKAPITDTL